jgi:uncharacterized protein YeaO (DUF488 family)
MRTAKTRRRAAARSKRKPARAKVARKTSRKPAGKSLIRIKRAYDRSAAADGIRVLVDRLWPRGISKARLKVDSWPRHLAPSTELRRWYHANPDKFATFRNRYLAELKAQNESIAALRDVLRGRAVTLLTASKNVRRTHADVLRAELSA